MAQSVIDICNSALQRCGASPIINLLDNSREARACNVAYDSNRRSELRGHFWNFAIKRVVLAADTVAPAFDYAYAFTLPTDCLRFQLPDDPDLDWVREGGKILTNYKQSPFGYGPTLGGLGTVYVPPGGVGTGSTTSVAPSLNLRYIYDVTDATVFDASFYDVLCIALALDICEVLTQSSPKRAGIAEDYKDAIVKARRLDAFEKLPEDPPDDEWLLARIR